MSRQGDWLEHARRHLDRAEWHRSRGGDDLVYARTELAGAISDLWTAVGEIEKVVKGPAPVMHLSPPHGSDVAPCGKFVIRFGEWSRLTRTTTDPDKVSCGECLAEREATDVVADAPDSAPDDAIGALVSSEASEAEASAGASSPEEDGP